MRPMLDDFGRTRREDFLALRGVVLLDVPGVEQPWLVDIGANLVAATGKTLAVCALVEDTLQRAVGREFHAHNLVLEKGFTDRQAGRRFEIALQNNRRG